MKKRITSLLLVVAMLLITCSGAFAAPVTAAAPAKGITVMVDGSYVPFGAAIPKIINGRTMVPFRAILEYLGAAVSYDKATKEITSTLGDKTITFKAGNSQLALKDAAKGNKDITMDVTPYLDKKLGSTYVSARFIAEAFSYNVGWDADAKTVIIIDFKKLFSDLDKDFTIISKLSNKLDITKTFKSVMTMNYVMEMFNEGESTKFPISVNTTTLQKGSSIDGTFLYSIDLSDAIKEGTDTQGVYSQELIDALKNLKFQIKMDGETFDLYIKCGALDSLPQVVKDMISVDGNTWIRITMDDLTKIYSQAGVNIDFKALMQASTGNKGLSVIGDLYSGLNVPLNIDSYATVSSSVEALKTAFGDKAFKVTKSGNQTTYEMSVSNASFSALLPEDAGTITFSSNIKFTEKAGVLGNYKAVINFNEEENGVAFSMDISGTSAMNGIGKVMFKVKDTINYDMSFTAKVTESNETFTSVPSSDEKVVDFSKLLSILMKMN